MKDSRRTWAAMIGVLLAACASATAQDASTTQPADDEERRELIERLRGGDGSGDGVFTRVLRNMQRSQERLKIKFDAGEETQRIQAQILDDLDEAIRTAKQMQSSGKRTRQKSETRRAGKRHDPSTTADSRQEQKSATGEEGTAMKGSPTEPRLGGRIEDTARGWGHLPERDREAVIQGMNETHRRQYEDPIRRYYESLAEPKRDE